MERGAMHGTIELNSVALVVGNFDPRIFEKPLSKILGLFGDHLSTRAYPGDQIFDLVHNPESDLPKNEGGANVLMVRPGDWTLGESDQALPQSLTIADEFLEAVTRLANRTGIPHLLCLVPSRNETEFASNSDVEWWRRFQTISKEHGLKAIHLRDEAVRHGVTDCIDPTRNRLGIMPYSDPFVAASSYAIARSLRAWLYSPRKLVAVDGDDTLWLGRCAEDHPSALLVDSGRAALHAFLRQKQQEGFLIALVSRNAEPDVERALAALEGNGFFLPHFAARRINWRPKSENLISISSELGIAQEDIVFLDDDPIECAEVRANCKVGVVASIPLDSKAAKDFLNNFWAWDTAVTTAVDRERYVLYERGKARSQAEGMFPTYKAFLESLRLLITVRRNTNEEKERVVQLLHRTTQFNTSGLKCGESEFQRFTDMGWECLVASASDRFGDYGLVGAVLFHLTGDALTCEVFVLSCRALNRCIEDKMLLAVAMLAREKGRKTVRVRVRQTDRNFPARDFLERVGNCLPPEDSDRMPDMIAFAAASLIARAIVTETAFGCDFTDVTRTGTRQPRSTGESLNTVRIPRQHRTDPYELLATELADAISLAHWIAGRPYGESERDGRKDGDIGSKNLDAVLRQIWAEAVGSLDFRDEDDFFDLSPDSLAAVAVLCEVEKRTGIQIELAVLFTEEFTLARLKELAVARSPIASNV
jgi:FkbH-like protein